MTRCIQRPSLVATCIESISPWERLTSRKAGRARDTIVDTYRHFQVTVAYGHPLCAIAHSRVFEDEVARLLKVSQPDAAAAGKAEAKARLEVDNILDAIRLGCCRFGGQPLREPHDLHVPLALMFQASAG